MKKILLWVGVCVLTATLYIGFQTDLVRAVGVPFGGPIVSTVYCPEGVLITVGPPLPGVFVASYVTPFLNGPPYRIGQLILGNFIPGIGTCFGIPTGLGFSTFYGTSL